MGKNRAWQKRGWEQPWGEIRWEGRPKVENRKGLKCPQNLGAERRGRRGLEEEYPRV